MIRSTSSPGLTGPGIVTALLVAALAAGAVAAVALVPLHHDIGWPLHVAGRILAGESLYGTIIEINPPLIFWYALLSEVLGSAIGTGGAFVYHALTTAIVLFGVWLTWRLLGRLLPEHPHARALVVVWFAFLAAPFAGYQYGQREHLLFAALVPYLLGAVLAAQGARLPRPSMFVAGLLTAFGLAMKPFFVPIWLGTELLVWRRAGAKAMLRPQAAGVLAGFGAYGAAVLIFAHDYLRIAEWGMASYAYFYPARMVEDILLSWQNAVAVIGLLIIVFGPRLRELDPLRWFAALAIATLTGAVYFQQKGWDYHWYPVLALAGLCTGIAAIAAASALASRRRLPAPLLHARAPRLAFVATAVCALAAGLMTSDRTIFRWANLNRSPYYLQAMTAAVEHHAPGGTILPLTTTMQVTVPLVNYLGLTQVSRFAAFWMLPAVYDGVRMSAQGYPYHTREQMGDMERYVFDAVVEDFERRPDVLVVDLMPPGRGMAGFDYIEYFGRSARFRTLLAEYRETALVGGRYRVFERVDALVGME